MTSDDEPPLPALGMLAELSADIRTQLASAGQFETLKPGSYLAIQGEPHHAMSIVLEGEVTVYVRNAADTMKVASIGPGETVGEMNIIDPLHKASADVVVTGRPARVFTIAETDFAALSQRDPAAGYAILKMLARELCRRLRRNSETLLKQADVTRSHFRDMDY